MKEYVERAILMFMMSALLGGSPAQADSDKTWRVISDVRVYSVLTGALITPVVHKDWEGLGRSALSVGGAIGVTTGLKALIHSRRPDGSDNNSFPSGHTTNAFSAATTLYLRYGWQVGFPAYAVATLTGVSRKISRRHRWVDVVAGAAIGTASGWLFTKKFNDKVQLWPWVERDGGGVTVAVVW